MPPITVFLLEDHALVRRGLREILLDSGEIDVVGESGLAREAARRIPALRPQVALLDTLLPDGTGVEVCREVHHRDPSIRTVLLSDQEDPEMLAAAVQAGAYGYLVKRVHGPEMASAVQRVVEGERIFHTFREDTPATSQRASASGFEGLTPQEERVLDLIIEGLTNRQIGQRLNITEKTVKNHVTSLMAKLHVERRTQAAVFGARMRGA